MPGRSLSIALVVAAAVITPSPSKAQVLAPQCQPPATWVRIPELVEGSGVAASRRTPGRLWATNDSGDAVVFALNGQGMVTGRVELSGASVDDWEAVAVGSCPAGSCIYVGDIGDNDANRRRVTVYRIAEPAEDEDPARVEQFHATYPDGAHDAESLLVADGRLYIVTKGGEGPVALYRFPADLRSGSTVRLERVGPPRDSRRPRAPDRITDGAVSPDGRWVVLRGARVLVFYRAEDLLAGNWREVGRLSLAALKEPQGEGVTFVSNDSIYVVGEGGGRGRPGTFAHVACTPVASLGPPRQ
jgi:hypothetical protein